RRRHTRLQGDWSSDVCSSDLMSLAGATPIVWGAVVAGVFLALYGRSARLLQLASLAALLVPLALSSFQSNLIWSPYYAIKVVKRSEERRVGKEGSSRWSREC